MRALIPLLALLAAPAPAAEAPADAPAATRYALVIGANDGGRDRVRLRYATADADAFADVMQSYGGVDPDHLIAVHDPDRAAVEAAFATVYTRIAEHGQRAPTPPSARPQGAGASTETKRTELLVFYSGHADEEGLLLGGERLPYAELRRHIDAVPADVRIAIVDACASGALIRAKGGDRRPPFLVDRASRVTGSAYLASASADEAAQESDRLGASFFSHALLTGLRGAADVTDDGVVTLNEAYQFAFRETLARTEGTRLGAQHALYDMQLVGSGDVVLTDLRQTSAGLVLDAPLTGRVFVRDAAGRLVAELYKPAGQAVRLGLAPGAYTVRVDAPRGQKLAGGVTLTDGATARVGLDGLTPVDGEVTVARGDEAPLEHRAFGASLVPGFATDDGHALRDVSINLVGQTGAVRLAEFGALVNYVEHDARGIRLAGALDVVEGRQAGARLAGAVSYIGGDSVGAAMSGALDIVGGDMTGVRVAGAANLVGGSSTGVGFAGAIDLVAGDMLGVQVAGGAVGTRGQFTGLQMAGAVTVAGSIEGLQLAGGATVAGAVDGAQIAPITVARDLDGMQLGVINVAREVDGLQFGVINVADDVDGLSFAVIPVIANGTHVLETFASELAVANLGLRLGTRHFHNIYSVGVNPLDGAKRFTWSFGFGGHFTLGDVLWLDLDLLGQGVVPDFDFGRDPFTVSTLRLLVGAQLFPHLAVYGGASWNATFDERDFEFGFDPSVETELGDVTLRQWPGAVVGLRF
ncbi:MAG: caspase family protein [Myxococcales bacterium]|nr:caspase family protein [Myxococcales bacterium]